MECLLCLESNQDMSNRIQVDSMQWLEFSIKEVIDKHLWPIETLTSNSYLCSSCWEELNDFHKFYTHIEEAHNSLKEFPATQTDPLLEDIKPKDLLMEDLLEMEIEIGPKLIISTAVKQEIEDISIVDSCGSDKDNDNQIDVLVDEDHAFSNESGEEGGDTNSDDDMPLINSTKSKCNPSGAKDKDDNAKAETETDKSKDTSENENNTARKLYQLSRISREQYDEFLNEHFKIICDKCEQPFERFSLLSEHYRKEHNERGFATCCDRKFFNRMQLVDHINYHLNPEYFKCALCDKVFARRNCLLGHMKIHDEKVYCCGICNKKFVHKYNLKKHMKALKHFPQSQNKKQCDDGSSDSDDDDSKMNSGSRTRTRSKSKPAEEEKSDEHDKFIKEYFKITCSKCEEDFERFYLFSQHCKKVHNEQGHVICCEMKLFGRMELVEHINYHLNPKCFKCVQCGKAFAKKSYLQFHMRYHEEQKYCCDMCDKKFVRAKILERHKLTHEERTFQCKECGKFYVNEAVLNQHQRVVHLNIYGKVCDICGQNIIGTYLFKLHMEKHDGLAAAKSFKCDDCGLKLGSKQALRLHIKVKHPVDGKRDHKCHLCNKVSPNMWALKRHIEGAHEVEEKYHCTVCEKKFKRPRYLKFHMATHTGIPLYRCPWCPKEFNASGNINLHRKKVHPVEWEEELRKKYSGNLPPNFKKY